MKQSLVIEFNTIFTQVITIHTWNVGFIGWFTVAVNGSWKVSLRRWIESTFVSTSHPQPSNDVHCMICRILRFRQVVCFLLVLCLFLFIYSFYLFIFCFLCFILLAKNFQTIVKSTCSPADPPAPAPPRKTMLRVYRIQHILFLSPMQQFLRIIRILRQANTIDFFYLLFF